MKRLRRGQNVENMNLVVFNDLGGEVLVGKVARVVKESERKVRAVWSTMGGFGVV